MDSTKRDNFAKNYAKRMKPDKSIADDDSRLRGREMSDDPMLEYFRQKEREKQGTSKEVPKFKGHYPPNRYNIRPGFRWDGVDRSNGHEKKLLDKDVTKKAREEENYRCSTRDL